MPRLLSLAARAALPLPLLLLSACGGGGGASAPAGDVGNYVPVSVGNRWVYQQDQDIGLGVVLHNFRLEKISGTTLVAGRAALVRNIATLVPGGTFIEGHIAKTATALVGVNDPATMPGHLAEITILRLPLTVGDSYVASDYTGLDSLGDADGDGLTERVDIHTTVDVLADETVTVPAGTFTARKVHTQSLYRVTYSKDASTFTSTDSTTDWYVAGLGKVKTTTDHVSNNSATGVTLSNSDTFMLAAWRVDGTSTDTTAPTVASHLPAAGATVAGTTEVSVTFSKDMDPYSLVYPLGNDAPWFTLVDAGGQPVPVASETYGSGKLTVTPQQPLAAGTYTATLQSATDALGNALAAPVSWTFTVN